MDDITSKRRKDHKAVESLIALHRTQPHVVACNHCNSHLYLTSEGLATDIRARALVYADWRNAAEAADTANMDKAWIEARIDWGVEPA